MSYIYIYNMSITKSSSKKNSSRKNSYNECLNYSLEETVVFFAKSDKDHVTFTEYDNKVIDDVCETLTELCKKEDMDFDKENFTTLLNSMYSHVRKSNKLTGGSKELDIYDDRKKSKKPKSGMFVDLAVTLMFLIGVILIYISYIKFTRTICELTATENLSDLSEEVQKAAQDALKGVPEEDVSFIYYFWSVFAGVSNKLLIGQQARMINVFSEAIKKIVTDSVSTLTTNCVTQNEGILGALEIMFTFTDPTSANTCIMQTSLILGDKAANDAKTQIALFTAKTALAVTQTTNIATYGSRLIIGSISYLSYRKYSLTQKSSRIEEIEGGKSKKNRKSKKSRK